MIIVKKEVLISDVVNAKSINIFSNLVGKRKNISIPYFEQLQEKSRKFELEIEKQLVKKCEFNILEKMPIWLEDHKLILRSDLLVQKILEGKENVEVLAVEDSGLSKKVINEAFNFYKESELDYLIWFYFKFFNVKCDISVKGYKKINKGNKTLFLEETHISKCIAFSEKGKKNIQKLRCGIVISKEIKECSFIVFNIKILKGTNVRINPIINMIFNANSLKLINDGEPFKYKKYLEKLSEFEHLIKRNNFNIDDFVIDSSGILGLYGMREPTDIDFITVEKHYRRIQNVFIDNHESILPAYNKTAEELIYDSTNYLYFKNIKFSAKEIVNLACHNQIEFTKKLDIILFYFIDKDKMTYIDNILLKLTKVFHFFIRSFIGKRSANAYIGKLLCLFTK